MPTTPLVGRCSIYGSYCSHPEVLDMAIILAQVSFQHDSGLPEDQAVNTFHFNGAATDGVANDLASWLIDFYNTDHSTFGNLSAYLSPVLSRTTSASRIKFYDVTSGPAGTPYHEVPFTINNPITDSPLPSEVSVCLSYRSAPLAGAIEARRRGRIYLGPLSIDALAFSGDIPRPDADLVACMLGKAQDLHDGAEISNAPWVIYSRANDSTSLVDVAWVDNAFDTQRRRGEAATARTTVTL